MINDIIYKHLIAPCFSNINAGRCYNSLYTSSASVPPRLQKTPYKKTMPGVTAITNFSNLQFNKARLLTEILLLDSIFKEKSCCLKNNVSTHA